MRVLRYTFAFGRIESIVIFVVFIRILYVLYLYVFYILHICQFLFLSLHPKKYILSDLYIIIYRVFIVTVQTICKNICDSLKKRL